MDGRTVAAAVLVLLLVLGGSQLAFTDVGKAQGNSFTPAVTLESMPAGPDAYVADLAAAGDGSRGAAAWIVVQDSQWSVHVAHLSIDDGVVTAEETVELVEGSQRIESVSIAVEGETTAVAYERARDNEVAVHLLPEDTQHVVGQDAVRTVETGVTLTDQGPVVGYQEYRNGTFRTTVTTLESGGQAQLVGGSTTGNGVPALATTDGQVTVLWYDAVNRTAVLTPGTVEGTGLTMEEHHQLGEAQVAGSFGGQGVMAMANDGSSSTVRNVWTDVGRVKTAEWSPGEPAGDSETLGVGERPGVATDETGWLAAWLVETRASGLDIEFVREQGGNATTGVVSQHQTDAIHPSPLFAPDPGVVWTERGAESQVLASGFREEATTDPMTRLRVNPERFLFIGLAGAVLGVVLTPMMPWNFIAFFVAFYATSATLRNRVERTIARRGNGDTESADLGRIRARIDAVPMWVWVAGFVVLDSVLLYFILPAGVSATAIEFSNPVGVSVVAAAGTAVMMVVRNWKSTWGPMIVFAYLQTVGLWLTGLPTIL